MDPELAHEQTAHWLEKVQGTAPGRAVLKGIAGTIPQQEPIELMGLQFPNAVGIAAGFDKQVRLAPGLAMLGFGHIEVGTLTPKAQPGNPKPRIHRIRKQNALINAMGFPNHGVEDAIPRLQKFSEQKSDWILGVSIGMQKTTPLENAIDDYRFCLEKVYPYSDYIAVNISSPNTPGLRELQGGRYLQDLVQKIMAHGEECAEKFNIKRKPIAVKIAPDLESSEIKEILEAVTAAKVDALIVSNTTKSRAGIPKEFNDLPGGLSGDPVRKRSTALIASIRKRLSPEEMPIIGVGGIRTAKHVHEKLNAGAQIVQVYTGLVYEGPGMAGKILRKL